MPTIPLLWVNGERHDVANPAISAVDRGFTRGDGVFETIRVYDGQIFELDRHLDRLQYSAARLGISVPSSIRASCTSSVAQASGEGLRELALRITVTRGAGYALALLDPSDDPTVVVALYELPPGPSRSAKQGCTLHIASCPKNERALTAGAKTLAYAESIAAMLEANAAGADDALFLDTRGFVSEGTTANVFFVQDGVLLTPALSCGVLAGITRAVVLEIAAALGTSTCEGEFPPSQLFAADEVFVTSSLREILPVAKIDGRPIAGGAVGPVTQALVAGFADRVLGAQ